MTSRTPVSADTPITDISGSDSDAGAYPFYAELREQQPVFWSERLQRWIISRYDDVLDAYRNPQVFSSRTFGTRGAAVDLADPAQDRVTATFTQQILLLDRPDHTRLRRLVSYAFTARSVAAMRDYTARVTRSLLDELRPSPTFDVVHLFAGPLPLAVITEIFKIDVADRDLYRAWLDSLAFVSGANESPEELLIAFRQVDHMRAYLLELVDHRRARPGDDLL